MTTIVILRVSYKALVSDLQFYEHYNLLANVDKLNNERYSGLYPAHALELHPDVTSKGPKSVAALIHDMDKIVDREGTLQTLVVISICLLFLRLLKTCHFQARMMNNT